MNYLNIAFRIAITAVLGITIYDVLTGTDLSQFGTVGNVARALVLAMAGVEVWRAMK